MAIYRGTGGAGDATTDAVLSKITEQAVIATNKADEAEDSADAASTSAASASASATSAASSASSAGTSATNASSSATAAETAETAAEAAQAAAETAQTAAELAETNAETAESSASTSASSAATSASNAATSATNSANSAAAASTSASNASSSATSAASDASDASDSAAAALTSENNAATSATTATTQATSASASAGAASTSATNAAASASAASTSETNASASETAASASETAAASSATSASTSASNAATSATNASNSATAASTSASSAATSATSAASSAGTATTQATAAASSATAAASSATSASSSASAASSSATDAETAQTAAEAAQAAAEAAEAGVASDAAAAATSASAAATSESNAATSASNAATSESNASSSATAAAGSAASAASSASAASASADAALSALDNFDDRYLGQKATAPTVDNDGDALVTGALYFDTVDDVMKVWDGSQWLSAYASLSGTLLANNNLSDLTNAATARTNLGLGTAATTNSTAYATAAQGTLADSALQSGDNISLLTNNSGYITGNQTITLSGDVAGSGTTSIEVTIADDSHNHIISNVDGLQAALDGKVDDSQVLTNVPSGAVFTDTTYSVGNGGLTEINFTSALNSKLAGIAAGANNYVLPFTDNSTNWNTAYGWGNHATAGYAAASSLGNYLPLSGGTLDGGTNTTLNIKADDNGLALIRLYGDSQGTGAVEVGQSTAYGGGISYNGDGSPGFVNGETADAITFYRLSNGVRTEVFSYPHNTNRVTFNEVPYVGGSAIWNAGNDGSGSGLDADLLDGQHASAFASASHNHAGVYQPAGTYNTIIGTDSDINTSGSTIIDNIFVTDGVITSMGTRTLTAGDLGALTGNQNITLSGDITGSGTTSINAQIASNVVGANELNVSGNGTAGQSLVSDGDGSMSWADAGVDSSYYSATPVLTSPETNKIVITNHSSYINPRYEVKLGSADITHSIEGDTISLSPDITETNTVTVTVYDTGVLFSSTSISMSLQEPAYRYIRLTGFVEGSNAFLTRFALFSERDGSDSNNSSLIPVYDINANYLGYDPTYSYYFAANTLTNDGWWLLTRSASQLLTDWIRIDQGTNPVPVKSVLIGWYTPSDYWATDAKIQGSFDAVTWTDIKTVTGMTPRSQNSVNL